MKRMITQELINKVNAVLETIDSGTLAPNKIQLDSVADLEISDLGALFPTPANGKFLVWDDGVLENADVPSGGTKLFKHTVNLGEENNIEGEFELSLISTSPTPLTSESTIDEVRALIDNAVRIFPFFDIGGFYQLLNHSHCFFNGGSGVDFWDDCSIVILPNTADTVVAL